MGMKCIGVDIGGTSVKIGLFETTGELLDKWEVKTRKEDGGVNILPDVAASIRKKLDEKGLDLKKDVAGAGMAFRDLLCQMDTWKYVSIWDGAT